MFKMDSSLDIIIVHDDTIVNLIRSVEHRQNENLDQLLDRPCDLLPKQNNATRPIDLSGMKFPKNQTNLTNLSNDLLLSIFSICDARSIVKLRQCCIDLREVSYNHTVWFEVLKGTCIDLGLPVPTFPQTTSTSTDFERLATAWIRFQSVLSYAKDGQPPPHKMVRSIDITERIIALQQSLDGRFLFVLHTTGIRVWSLEDVSPLQVHYFGAECPTNFEAFLWVVNETSNSTILCLVWGTAKSHDCFAFRFSFPSHGHQGTQLISLSKFDFRHFPIKDWKCVVAKSTLFTALYTHPVEGTCYLLFDLVGGACATWRAESFDNPSNLFITRGFIVSLNGENQAMVVYALPELPEKDSYAPQIWAKLSNPALFHVSARPDRLNHQRVSRVSFMRSSTNGYAHSDYRGNVLINEDPDGHWLLEIVALHQTTELVSETFPALPLELERSTLQIRDHHSFPISQAKMGYAYMSPDQNLLLYATSSDGAQIVFHLSALAKDGSRVELKRGILCDSDDEFEFDDATMSLCPFTGRLCVASSDRIKVIDFVTI
ncbi:hypothetical protein DL96DRAFT_269673 [Flagelloscypha sp. PMI_526]|nr:hypothetical protein DL96DRAFT_269673 [Flagelloscypha sp. PMI_526]